MRKMTWFILFVVLGPALAGAQGISGSIQGTVVDKSGAAIPDARVLARNLDTGIIVETRSNDAGLYFVGELRPGRYELEADVTGFSTFRQTGIILRIEDRLRVDIRLDLRTVSSSVEVVGEAPIVQSENNTIGKVVEERHIKQLPLSGRNAFALTLLVPGVQQRRDDEHPRLSGGRSRNGEFLVDGMSITDVRRGELRTQPNLDAIQEFKVQTAGLSADVGRAVGGIVNSTLKSGTNEFHGNVYEFHRNDNLNARNAFARTVPKLIQNQFGGMIGGPIIKQRTFFFADYEGFRTAREEVFTVTVPTPRMKSGDFGELLGAQIGTDPLGRPILRNQLYDPNTTRRLDDGRTVRDPIPGNVIPATLLDPAGLKVISYYPDPTGPGTASNFLKQPAAGDNFNKFDVRLDHQITSRNQMFFRLSHDRQRVLDSRPFTYAAAGVRGRFDRWISGALGWTSTLTPATINELRVTAQRGNMEAAGGTHDNSLLGIPNVVPTGMPQFFAPGSVERLVEQGRTDPKQEMYQIQDTATFVRGRHIFRFGGDARRFRVNDRQLDQSGRYNFSRVQTAEPSALGTTGYDLASLMMGQTDYYQQSTNQDFYYKRSSYFAWFVQDDIKVTPAFTLNVGLRYELEQSPAETRGRGGNFDLRLGRPVSMQELGTNRIQATDKNNFAPRVGFAWQPFGLGSTVIRSHYGIFYIPLTGRATGGFNAWPHDQSMEMLSDGLSAAIVLSRAPKLVPSVDGKGQAHFAYDPEPPVGYFQQWSFDLQHEIAGILLQAAYVGSTAKHLLANYSWNEMPIEVARAGGAGDRRFLPFPDFATISSQDERGSSTYNALQVSAEKRFGKGLSFLLSYSWSKTLDDSEDNFSTMFPISVFDLQLEKSLSLAHFPKRFVGALVYDLPFGKGRRFHSDGWLSHVLGGWQTSGIVTLQSGAQVWIQQPANTARTFSRAFRPNLISNPILPEEERTLTRWFNTDAFQAPLPITLGNSSKTPGAGIEGPGLARVDFSVNRFVPIPIRDSMRLEFRAEFFNLFNRVNYNEPNGQFGTPNFGRVSAAGDARVTQFALKLWF